MEEEPVCPICGCSCRKIIIDRYFKIVGCNICTEEMDAEEWYEKKKLCMAQ